jgi:hypothetical protein
VLWGFFDESGKFADSDFVCLCGYLSNQNWSAFTERWRALLMRHGFASLHMSQINWRDERQVTSLRDFAGAIREHVPLGFGVAVDVKYYRHMPIEKRRLLGDKDPRDFTFHQLLRLVLTDLHSQGMEDWLSMTFDFEDGFSVECLRSLLQLRKNRKYIRELVKNIAFADDETYYPLQAADMFAYGYKRSLQGNPPDYWSVLVDPLDSNTGPRCVVAYFDPPHLEETCAHARQLQERSRENAMKASEFGNFNEAMDAILKADPAKVKAQMEAEKRANAEKRKTKKSFAADRVSGDKD